MIMAKVSEITTMCKTGQVESAYSIARLDYEAHPDNVWTQIGLGWALYYKIRKRWPARVFTAWWQT